MEKANAEKMSNKVNKPSIVLASDHAGFELKEFLIRELQARGYLTVDEGTNSCESADYPDYAHTLAQRVTINEDNIGVLICGSANGVNMTANKHRGVRAAIAWTTEIAQLARMHNDANVVSLPARFISQETALEIALAFLNTTFEGGRHSRRVDKIDLREKV